MTYQEFQILKRITSEYDRKEIDHIRNSMPDTLEKIEKSATYEIYLRNYES